MPRRRAPEPRTATSATGLQNDFDVLVTLYGPRTDQLRPTLLICGAKGCWDQARERGYKTSHQLEDERRRPQT